jgi:endonuclease/exonuclease/phosphatase family metal-dependent hydrolase
MVNVHLDPQDAVVEMNHLADVLSRLESLYQDQEDDILLVGDFNLSPGKILSETPFSTRPSWKPVLDDRVPTNTRQDKAYDNILLHSDRTSEFLGRCGVIDLQQRFRISLEEALEISDHLPVWAAFTLSEAESANVAAQATDAALR